MLLRKHFTKSLRRIAKDFQQRELLPLKLVFFVQASTISVLYPYLTIHMRELGINVEEAAIMSAVIPVIGIIMPPLAGMIADKIGNFKMLLSFFSLIGGATSLLLLLVPVGRITVTHPERITLNMGCGHVPGSNQTDVDGGFFQLGLSDDIFCDRVPELKESHVKKFHLESARFEGCGFVCRTPDKIRQSPGEEPEGNSTSDVILAGRSYAVRVKTDDDRYEYHRYNLTKEEASAKQTTEDILGRRIPTNDEHLTRAVRRIGPYQYFFPSSELSGLTCRKRTRPGSDEGDYVCRMEPSGEYAADGGNLSISSPSVNATLNLALSEIRNETKGTNQFKSDFFFHMPNSTRSENVKFSCEISKIRQVSVSVYVGQPENGSDFNETIPLTDCRPRCLLTTPRKSMCLNLKEEIIYDPRLTFWIYLIIRVFIGIIGSTSYAMYEVAVIANLREHKADYGLQRIYASIGGMISSPLSGFLIDYASRGKNYADFRPAFYLYAALKVTTSILMLFINLEFKKAASNVLSDAIQVLKNLEVIALLTACFVLGTAWGYIESFLFWFLEDLGGTRSLMGITITVGGIAGIPLLVLSGPIIDKIGHANVLFIGFLFYAVRLIGYSLIYNPYHCLVFEAMESITSSLAITAAVTYAAKLSTTTTDGSIQGLVGGLYFGVGRGAGSLIGGYLMKEFGTRQTYRILAVFSLLTGFLYYFFNQFYISKRPQVEGNEICKKPAKNADSFGIAENSKEYGTMKSENNNADLESGKMEDGKGKVEKERENQDGEGGDEDGTKEFRKDSPEIIPQGEKDQQSEKKKEE